MPSTSPDAESLLSTSQTEDLSHSSLEKPKEEERPIATRKSSDKLAQYGSTTTSAPPTKKKRIPRVIGSDRKSLRRTQTSFYDDAINMREGTIPQSIVVATVVGVVCGLSAYLYYEVLEFFLDFLWHKLPERFVVDIWPEWAYVLWVPLMGFTMAIGVGLSVVFLGEPGDLAYTIKCVHDKAFISMDHVLPMLAASQFSILGGGSLGPEAPLVAICAAMGGFVSRYIFKMTNRNVIRKHTLMGMAGALAAFFGCPLGGSLFALEVNSRFGVEYFEHVVESIFCGEVTLVVFRWAAGLPIAPIWTMKDILTDSDPSIVIWGAFVGLLGAGIAALFATFHWRIVDMFDRLNLLDNKNAVARALVGATVIVGLGMMVPHTMFWGEFEFQGISSMAPAKELDHVFPTTGLFGFEMETFSHCLIVGFCKLIAISFTVAGGYRGGFIFPFFAAGAAFGRALNIAIPTIPVPIACLCFAAGINVAITRTSLATTLILAFLAGEQNAVSAILFASLSSLFATAYMPFIRSQIIRSDMDDSIYLAFDEHMDEDWKPNRHHKSHSVEESGSEEEALELVV